MIREVVKKALHTGRCSQTAQCARLVRSEVPYDLSIGPRHLLSLSGEAALRLISRENAECTSANSICVTRFLHARMHSTLAAGAYWWSAALLIDDPTFRLANRPRRFD